MTTTSPTPVILAFTLTFGILHGFRGLFLVPAHPWYTQPLGFAPLVVSLIWGIHLARSHAPRRVALQGTAFLWLGGTVVAWMVELAYMVTRVSASVAVTMIGPLVWLGALYSAATLGSFELANHRASLHPPGGAV